MGKKVRRIELDVEQLEMLLKEQGMSAKELSIACGKSDGFIKKYIQHPYALYEPLAELIAEKLGVDLFEFMKIPTAEDLFMPIKEEPATLETVNAKLEQVIGLLENIQDLLKK